MRSPLVCALVGLAFFALVQAPAPAQTIQSATDLELSGFADVVCSSIRENHRADHFRLGQVELDLTYLFNGQIRSDLAIAYDEGAFGIGAMTIGFLPTEWTEIYVGQFDVPFGIDFDLFRSPDRKLISAPLVTEKTHQLWNDIGIKLLTEWRDFGFALFAVNGLGEAEVVIVPGSRLSYSPADLFEFGGSVAVGLTDDGGAETALFGADIQLTYKRFYLKGEHIEHRYDRTAEEKSTAGFYLQATFDVDPLFFCARYGGLDSDEPDLDELDRVTLGAGYGVIEKVELRGEYQIYVPDWEKDRLLLQTVASF